MINRSIRLLNVRTFQLVKCLISRRWQSSSSYNSNYDDLIPPTTCCMSNCANCVWISFAEEIAQRYPNAAKEVIDGVLKRYIEDKSFREFLELEIQMRSIGNKK